MNQAALSPDIIPCSPATTSYLSESSLKHEGDAVLQPQDIIVIQKPKNVPEELKMFLMTHSDQWYTNEQLAEHLNHTASGIRNAVTKLKSTGLIKTRMTGPLAYRGWHTASIDQPLPMPEVQKRLAARKCNRCETTYSRYWRSDLEEPNKWLCNNCGMNQRRGRLNQRQTSQSDNSKTPRSSSHMHNGDAYSPCDYASGYNADINSGSTIVAEETQITTDTRRRCANCFTYKSAGKWRRDRENYANYLCNKCGMNQRRASMRKANEALKAERVLVSGQGSYSSSSLAQEMIDSTYRKRGTRQRQNLPDCSRCHQPFPSLEVDPCKHRFCGECIPTLVHQAIGKNSLECPICQTDSPDALPVLIATAILGGFLLDNFDQN